MPSPPPISTRLFSLSSALHHQNPLGLPRAAAPAPPSLPRRGGPAAKRPIPHVKRVLVVASGKGGVGKSTVAVNLAFALAMRAGERRLRVGLLDLDIFGPSIPKLMGLDRADEPHLTPAGALVPLTNHGIPCMSMGFLLPKSTPAPGSSASAGSSADTPVVWRGLMVQKAVQQLLFDVDWRLGARAGAGADASGSGTETGSGSGTGLDVLVVDMPPGTGDVPLTLGQLVAVDGAVIVSTPQDVALADVRKGIAMFRKVGVPITGLLLNQSYFLCPSCDVRHDLFGSADLFHATARQLGVPVLGELPLAPEVSGSGDAGAPYALLGAPRAGGAGEGGGAGGGGGARWREGLEEVAERVWRALV